MSDRAKAAADRIREVVPILEVLATYDYRVRVDGGSREQQFQCDLHGSGRDNKPSARVYPESNSWYCFACDVTRDPIGTVMAKEGVKFWGAIKLLEQAYGLEPLPIDYGTDEASKPGAISLMAAVLDPTVTFSQDAAKMQSFLDRITYNRDLPLDQILRFWEKFDEVVHYLEEGHWQEGHARVMLQGLRDRINEARNTPRAP